MTRASLSLAIIVLLLALFAPAAFAAGNVKVTVCHIPPDDPDNFHSITISVNALDAHIAHGDLTGSCDQFCEALCNDGNACTIDACDPETGVCMADHEPVNCDDWLNCTTDTCDISSGCVYLPAVCPDDGNLCTVASCTESAGCVAAAVVCSTNEFCHPDTGDCVVDGSAGTSGFITLLDHAGNGLVGGTAKWGCGTWHDVPGSTDTDGKLWFEADLNFCKIDVIAPKGGGTSRQTEAETAASGFTWHTDEVVISLIDHSENVITNGGGQVSVSSGSWFDLGFTDAFGMVRHEMFLPTSRKFRMTFNSGAQEKTESFVEFPGDNEMIFQTGELRGGSCKQVAPSGSWLSYDSTGMEFLPKCVKFQGCPTGTEYCASIAGTSRVFGSECPDACNLP